MGYLKKIDEKLEAMIEYVAKKPWPFLIVVMCIDAFLKGFNLHDASLWLDEASQIRMSLLSVRDIIIDSLSYPNAPFYTILLSFWIGLLNRRGGHTLPVSSF